VSHLYSVGADGKAADFPRADWFKMVESRKSAKDSGSERRDRIVSIDFSVPAPPSPRSNARSRRATSPTT
jgi:hypothetical protein